MTVPQSQPTVSAPWAMARYPHARDAEVDALLARCPLVPGMTIVDLQAAGGYLSDAVFARLDGAVTCLCVEPSDALRARLDPRYVALPDALEHLESVADGCADAVLGLAGLHHSDAHDATVAEAYRVLRPGGSCVICDVTTGSVEARWLDGFVDRHCPTGHVGHFPAPGGMADLFAAAGFSDIDEQRVDVSWRFPSRPAMAAFCRGLFGLSCDVDAVHDALNDHFDVREDAGTILLPWQLAYARATRPR